MEMEMERLFVIIAVKRPTPSLFTAIITKGPPHSQ